jgi:hypothetical protein
MEKIEYIKWTNEHMQKRQRLAEEINIELMNAVSNLTLRRHLQGKMKRPLVISERKTKNKERRPADFTKH